MTRVWLIGRFIGLRVTSGVCVRRSIVTIIVRPAIRVHDHTTDLVEIRWRRIGHVMMVVRMITRWQRVEAQRTG